MQVILIGSGNMATLLGKLLFDKGHRIMQVYSRRAANAEKLAALLQATPVTDLQLVDDGADLYLIAVTDDALPVVAAALALKDKLVIHTAGSVSKEILKNTSSAYGVLWPMKMIRRSTTTLYPANIIIDGNTETVIQKIQEIAHEFSESFIRADDTERAKMHMVAALTTNFSNHLYHLAADYCSKENIDFSYFYPLMEAAVQQIREQHPRELQAGPAFRGDIKTIEKHEQFLENYPQILNVYKVMTESIETSFRP
jgi:predicted short-subunit dehydrogenase-like oxidoreductase (DUF2520 family)